MKRKKPVRDTGPNCPRCKRVRKIDEAMTTAMNYGMPTDMWWCSLCGHLEDKAVLSDWQVND